MSATETLRYLGDGRELEDRPLPDDLSDKDLLELFGWLIRLRTFDERAVALQRQGRIGTYPLFWGEEGTQAGPLYAMSESDWVFPSYRQCAIGTLRGVSIATILGWVRGYNGPAGFYNPRDFRVGPICVPIATHLLHAVGVAWAAKIRGEDVASLAWFGDGGTSEGDFHEALNFASVFKTATVFFCTNNQWAISTPVTRQMANTHIADKALGYGMPGVRVDGFDPIACWKATKDALQRARAGEGPTLIEAFCYRIAAHGTADDPKLYRDEAEAEKWKPLEPVGRMASFLKRQGLIDDDRIEEMRADARAAIARGVKEMEAIGRLPEEVVFEHVYASEMPWTLREGLEELKAAGVPAGVDPVGPLPGPQTSEVQQDTASDRQGGGRA
ncbi:MAG TPA: thiamine pyrophosphate-dependent enzyme [Actinomycetota bacterium]|nr:thiamine pyrophosphate-dependent enzyme [Actinomycetota bacterium]